MTMHVVLGDGEMTNKELSDTLQDLYDRAEADGQTFWLLVQAKPEPAATDRNLMKWLATNEIYYETIGDGSEVPDIYDGAQERHTVKRLAPKVLSLMNQKPEEGEDADLLALFVSDDPEAEDDRWLNEVIQTVADGGYKIYALNDGLVEVDVTEAAEEAEQEPEPPVKKAAAKKVAAKKVAAAKKAAAPDGDEEEAEPSAAFDRDILEDKTIDQLKAIAADMGIEFPPRTRSGTYINAILGETEEAPGIEVETPPASVTSTGPAMMIVVYNGTVTTIPVTPEEAAAILSTK